MRARAARLPHRPRPLSHPGRADRRAPVGEARRPDERALRRQQGAQARAPARRGARRGQDARAHARRGGEPPGRRDGRSTARARGSRSTPSSCRSRRRRMRAERAGGARAAVCTPRRVPRGASRRVRRVALGAAMRTSSRSAARTRWARSASSTPRASSRRRCAPAQLPEPDVVVVALGSGGTAAGLAVGFEQAGLRTRVLGVVVAPPTPVLAPPRAAARAEDRCARGAAGLRGAARGEAHRRRRKVDGPRLRSSDRGGTRGDGDRAGAGARARSDVHGEGLRVRARVVRARRRAATSSTGTRCRRRHCCPCSATRSWSCRAPSRACCADPCGCATACNSVRGTTCIVHHDRSELGSRVVRSACSVKRGSGPEG